MKKSFAQILSDMNGDRVRKMALKLPSWAAAGCTVPRALALEQCSSEATASYKAGLIPKDCMTLADLTGGLGVDCHAFSLHCSRVIYFEKHRELATAAADNFAKLGANGIDVHCAESGISLLQSQDFPDCGCIFLDPARRDATGKKLFLLEECSPNVLELLPELWRHTPFVMLKLSPMADIAMVAARLGKRLSEVHVVGLGGEVKELLCLLERDHNGPFRTIATILGKDGEVTASLEIGNGGEQAYAAPGTGMTLFEPGGILLKAGAFKLDGMRKLAPSTHLFIENGDNPYAPFGRRFRIIGVMDFGKAGFREVREKYPVAEVSARNLPITSDGLRRRLNTKPGGRIHIFGAATPDSRVLIVGERI